MSKAIAFLAGLGAGYFDAEGKKRDRARQDERDQREKTVFDAQMQDRTEARADKDALRAAAAPVTVDSAPVAPPIGSRDAPREPEDQGVRVAGKTYTDRASADAAAADANAPAARRARIASELIRQGKVIEADQLAANDLTNRANQIKVDDAQRTQANQLFDEGVRKALQAGGWDGLAKFMSDSVADGAGGQAKFQAQRSQDGKVRIMRVGEDGALSPAGPAFSDSEDGMATAGFMLSRAVPEAEKLKHALEVKKATSTEQYQAGMLGVAQKNANTNEAYRRDQAENMRQQRAIEAQRIKALSEKATSPGGPLQITLKDQRDFEGDMNAILKDRFPVSEAGSPEERAAVSNQANSQRALATALFRNNASVGIPLTAGSVVEAMSLAADRKNVRVFQVNGVPHEGVVVNGQAVITSGPLQRREAGGAAQVQAPGNVATPATQPAGQPAAQPGPAIPVDPALKAPPAAGQPAQSTPAAQAARGVDAISPEHRRVLDGMASDIKGRIGTYEQALVAAERSGDQRAVQAYAAQVTKARAELTALEREAVRRLGPNVAQEYLASIQQR